MTPGGSTPGWNAVVPLSGSSAHSTGGTFDNSVYINVKAAFTLSDTAFQVSPEPGLAGMLAGGLGILRSLCRKRRFQ